VKTNIKIDLPTEVFRNWQTAGSPVPYDTSARRGSRKYNAHIYNDEAGKLRLDIADADKPMSIGFYLGKVGPWEITQPDSPEILRASDLPGHKSSGQSPSATPEAANAK